MLLRRKSKIIPLVLTHKYQANACGFVYKRLTTQYVQGARSRHGFNEKHMILGY
jgi:hypothetical protein